MKKFFILPLLILSIYASAAVSDSPCLVSLHVPYYPPLARTARVQGSVTVNIRIDENGKVNVKKSSGTPMLVAATEENVKTWQFAPAASRKLSEITVDYKYILDDGSEKNVAGCANFKVIGPTSVEIYGVAPLVQPNNAKTK